MTKVLLVVEDDKDIRFLVRLQFSLDPTFELDGEAIDIDGATAAAHGSSPDLVILDHLLEGDVTGLAGAPRLKDAAPNCRIILFSASEDVRVAALGEPAVDAFLLKTHIDRLVPVARQLLSS